MSAGISAITLSVPIIAANAVFAPRRLKKGSDAMSSDPIYGLLNYDIAAGQTVKGISAVQNLSAASESSASEAIKDASKVAETASKTSKIGKGAIKLFKFTAENINPIICVTSGLKVLNSDDKVETGINEGAALLGMFAAEKGAKNLVGMPGMKRNNETGRLESVEREALYRKNPFLDKQVSAIKDFCETKKLFNKVSLKAVPPVARGLIFVGASIGGYAGGEKLGKLLSSSLKPQKKAETAAL